MKHFKNFFFQEAEKSHQEELERAEKEKQELTEKLEDMMQQESTLAAKVSAKS